MVKQIPYEYDACSAFTYNYEEFMATLNDLVKNEYQKSENKVETYGLRGKSS